MKNIWVLILVVVIVVVLSLFLFSFQVRETEKAVVFRFGKHIRTIEDPGWKLKLPVPIDVVYTYDSRAQLYERPMEETTTAGGEPVIVSSYVIWRIGDPLQFKNSFKSQREAEKQLYSLLGGAQNEVVGQHYFSEFVNADPDKIQFEQIEQEMLARIRANAMGPDEENEYGFDILAVGIKQLNVSKDVTQNVFDRMKADRKRKTEEILKEGEAIATQIRADAEAKKTELLAIVEAQAKAIRGQGDAEAARYYEKLESHPELAMFLRDLEALRKILKEKSTIVLGADMDPLRLLKEMPDLEAAAAERTAREGKATERVSAVN